MLRILITEEADNDLLKIAEYTQTEWGYEQRVKYIKALYDRMTWLSENPHHGKNRDEIKKGYFSYLEGRHQIFYQVENNDLRIIGVLHQAMDFKRHL